MQSLYPNTNISKDFIESDDYEQVKQILFDWVIFDKEKFSNLLQFAIETEIYFLFNPANALTAFIFGENDECSINEIELKFEFFSDQQGIIKELANELIEIGNYKKTMLSKDFKDLTNDILFKIAQNQSIEEFLSPLMRFLRTAEIETLAIEVIEIFFAKRDLAGILSYIKDYAIEQNKEEFSYEELLSLLNSLFENDNINSSNNLKTTDNIDITADSSTGSNEIDELNIALEALDNNNAIDSENPESTRNTDEKPIEVEFIDNFDENINNESTNDVIDGIEQEFVEDDENEYNEESENNNPQFQNIIEDLIDKAENIISNAGNNIKEIAGKAIEQALPTIENFINAIENEFSDEVNPETTAETATSAASTPEVDILWEDEDTNETEITEESVEIDESDLEVEADINIENADIPEQQTEIAIEEEFVDNITEDNIIKTTELQTDANKANEKICGTITKMHLEGISIFEIANEYVNLENNYLISLKDRLFAHN